MLCYVMLCYAMLCYVMLCCVVLCSVVSCRVVLCCVELCCVVLCCVQVNSSREYPPGQTPGHLKKLFKCPALRVIFVDKCPATPPPPFLL